MTVASACSRRRFLEGAASAAGLFYVESQIGCAVHGTPSWQEDARSALRRSHAWLWEAQASDGRFQSTTYGLLSSGQSLTPFVLESLLQGPRDLVAGASERVARALYAMISMRGESGALGFAAPGPDYPCYATGLLLSCLGAARPAAWQQRAARSVDWLRTQQFRAEDGWAGHPAQGGWGMGATTTRTPPNAGHVDLSMTRRVVEGLRAVGVRTDDSSFDQAKDFVERCQTSEGSFVYSPVELALNKGLRDEAGQPRGYGSATTDGLLALRALGEADGERFQAGEQWLRAHHRVDRNPGLDGGPMEAFAEAMRNYYRAGAARCFAASVGPEGWQRQLAAAVAAEQRDDGSFLGVSGLQKEDDPLIATAFAVQALAASLA